MRWYVLALALTLGMALVACGGSGSQPAETATQGPPTSATAPAATPTDSPDPSPIPDPLEVLKRSGEAMATAAPFRVEAARWPGAPGIEASGMVVREYLGDELRYASTEGEAPDCGTREVWDPPFTRREEGALVFYRGQNGATAPEVIELLDARSVGGPDAWVVRYRFTWPSVETPIPVERTEWIAKDTFLLLRVEEEQFDPLGWIGQEVMAFSSEVTSADACALTPALTRDELRPTTGRRLENPSATLPD